MLVFIQRLILTEQLREIFQHIDNIKGANKDFTWESIVDYDEKFRELMSMFPMRNWEIIYSQAWMKTLKPKCHEGKTSKDR